jgi:hypothetical protein
LFQVHINSECKYLVTEQYQLKFKKKLMAASYSEKTGIYPSVPTGDPPTVAPSTVDPDVRDPHDINKHLRV